MEGMDRAKLPIADYKRYTRKRIEGIERAKLPIAHYSKVYKEENGRNGQSKISYSRLHKGKQGGEWKEESYL